MIRHRAFPEPWLRLLNSRVPYYSFLDSSLKEKLKIHMPVILDEKIFEGCGGLEMTEEKRVVIAAYATVLILGDPAGYYPDLHAILVYPGDYVAPVREEDEWGIVTEGTEARSGESWHSGSLVLSWRDIQRDIQHPFNGRNLIFHEFAHQLDEKYGLTAGIDESGNARTSTEWNELLAKNYRILRSSAAAGRKSILDPYGATHPAEFFAVATECFFENAHQMKQRMPELYEMFRGFYYMDPAAYLPSGGKTTG
ncbi:MAG: M90 family metallopeptidase [Balneolaceae bacterium]